ncbi:LuxR family two component transcriptional regulator [Roseivirga pacifica]|uniref:Two component transcriptional regulator, LuxR family n=1 Tax=Roseivirga pacifica TaxID=1267423 RepID=A0A1I0QYC7_9BACT|nr:response regulator transcription factor [Roseivirga pacifica]RKQ42344.1 LuxR family two component transcriptional regulator [Roseivirga pacifica]SEW32844.1 two component transcriptional regulator, LuxR family [Roseivirga pacifica]
MSEIKVFLVDDHKMIRDAIDSYLEDDGRFTVVGQANHGQEALNMIKAGADFDVLLTDIVMPSMDGIELVKQLKEEGLSVKIVALTMLSETQHIKKMLNYGVNGYVLKSASQEEIVKAILEVYEGRNYYSPEVTNTIMDHLRGGKQTKSAVSLDIPLTKREKEVLHLIIKEFSNGEIAEKLFISVRTVEAHKRNLLEKTGHKNMAGLAIWALEKRLFDDI